MKSLIIALFPLMAFAGFKEASNDFLYNYKEAKTNKKDV